MEKKRWVYYLTRPLLSAADAVVCLTEAIQQWLQERGIAEGRASVIASGVDTHSFRPRDKITLRRQLGLPPEKLILLYVGNLVPYKGVKILVDAVYLMKASHSVLVLIGDGEERLSLEERVSRLGLSQRIRFVGAIPPDQVPLWMAAADLFVLPSFSEGRSNVLLEAMASGLPVVATDIPGNREAVSAGETGLLVPPGDPDSLAMALESMVANKELIVQMGKAGQLSIQERRWTWEECASRHVELYRELVRHGDLSHRARH
jgi:glycosyltransferase involved in cell wall biosynthesis